MKKPQRSSEKNDSADEVPMDPLVPQVPKTKPDSIKRKPYSSEQVDEKKQKADADKFGEQTVRSGLV